MKSIKRTNTNSHLLVVLALPLMFLVATVALNGQASSLGKPNPADSKHLEAKNMKKPQYEITVSQNDAELGKITIETFPEEAPKHAANFDSLVAIGFYDGTAFHRVIPGFMIQGGDPNTKKFPDDRSRWGMGDPSQTRVPAEFNKGKQDWTHRRGILSAARSSDPNSATSQFFIMHQNSKQLDGQYSIYGQVLEGIDIVDKVVNTPCDSRDAPIQTITMKIKKLTK